MYRRLYFLPVQGKYLPVKTGICRSSGGSAYCVVYGIQGGKYEGKKHLDFHYSETKLIIWKFRQNKVQILSSTQQRTNGQTDVKQQIGVEQ